LHRTGHRPHRGTGCRQVSVFPINRLFDPGARAADGLATQLENAT
jgi:hypothetical protein